MRMNDEQVQEEEEEEVGPWEEVIKRKQWKRRPPYYSTEIEMKKKKKKWMLASVIIYQSNTSCLQIIFFNGSLFSSIEKPPKEKERWGWEYLPSTALLNIFCKSELKDRLQSIPLVCKSWKYVTDDPRCWHSMIPDSVSPEDAFIKSTSGYEFESYECKSYYMKLVKKKDFLIGISRLFKEEGDLDQDEDEDEDEEIDEEEEEVPVGLSRLRTLIKKSGGGAAITTLYLSPFLEWSGDNNDVMKVLHLIANCCPNLKHISFKTFGKAPTEALFQFFNKCKKLELVDLSYTGFDEDDLLVILQEMGKCLPNLHGIRIEGLDPGPISVSIATYLPQLNLLSLFIHHLDDKHLSTILFNCLELQYLYVKGHLRWLYYRQDIVDQASAQISECYFDKYYHQSSDNWYWGYNYYSETEDLERNETEMDDEYLRIQKQRKEDQYVCILKKKVKYYHILKNKERDHQCNSSFKKKKKKKKKYQYDSTVGKKKKIDQCDYADYVIR